jgi:very-short-patch-repair endonuclease
MIQKLGNPRTGQCDPAEIEQLGLATPQQPAAANNEIRRHERLANPTLEEDVVSEILTRLGFEHEREKIWMNGGSAIFTDLYIPALRLVIEVDGNYHRDPKQQQCDHQRSMWLARRHKCHVVRIWNSEVASGKAEEGIKQMLGLKPPFQETP